MFLYCVSIEYCLELKDTETDKEVGGGEGNLFLFLVKI